MNVKPKTAAFPYPTLRVDVPELIALHKAIMAQPHHYKLGAKLAKDWRPKAGQLCQVDCSGLVRYLMLNEGQDAFPDGSYSQHDAVKAAGLKPSNAAALALADDALRIVFLSPQDGGGIGHVALWHNGLSIESHGGIGPDRRHPYQCPWLSSASVYVVTAPGSE